MDRARRRARPRIRTAKPAGDSPLAGRSHEGAERLHAARVAIGPTYHRLLHARLEQRRPKNARKIEFLFRVMSNGDVPVSGSALGTTCAAPEACAKAATATCCGGFRPSPCTSFVPRSATSYSIIPTFPRHGLVPNHRPRDRGRSEGRARRRLGPDRERLQFPGAAHPGETVLRRAWSRRGAPESVFRGRRYLSGLRSQVPL